MGWVRGLIFILAISAMPQAVLADFVHVRPTDGPVRHDGSVPLPSTATPADPVTFPARISTAPDRSTSASEGDPDGNDASLSEQVAATLAKTPPLQLPPDGAAKGVRPLVLNERVNPTVPEPSMLRVASLALTAMLARRRRESPAPVGHA